MIPAFLLTFVGKFVEPQFVRKASGYLMIGGFILLLVVSGGIWLRLHDRAVIRDDRAKANVEASQASERATGAAWWQLSIDQQANRTRSDELRKDIANETDSGPVGNRTGALYERLRERQKDPVD